MTNLPPHAPMAPDVAHPVDDHDNYPDVAPAYHDDQKIQLDHEKKPKKTKKPKSIEPVERELFGFSLEPVPARAGENRCWQRVGRRTLPFEQQKLFKMVTEHRKNTRVGPAHDLGLCTSAQQGVINRLILECKQGEKNPNADWVLVDIQRFGDWKWRTLVIYRIQVILKRQDKNLSKPKDAAVHPNLGGYQEFEIIDLAEPLKDPRSEKKDKKSKKERSNDEVNLDDPPALRVLDSDEQQYGDQDLQGNQQQDGHVQNEHAPYEHHDLVPPPPSPPPQQNRQYFDHMSQAGQSWGPPQAPLGRASNPFQSNFELMPPPGNYDSNNLNNLGHSNQYSTRLSARTPPPPPPERHSPSPRRSRSKTKLRTALERERADNAELQSQLERLNLSQRPASDYSSGSPYSDSPSVFSQHPVGEAFTPPSTPPRSEFYEPRSSLHRRRYSDLREPCYEPRRYRDESVDVRTVYTARPRQRELPAPYRRVTAPHPRPAVVHTSTYDDYPREKRLYLPVGTPRLQRRLTENGHRYHPEAIFSHEYGRRESERRNGAAYEPRPMYERRRSERLFGDERYT